MQKLYNWDIKVGDRYMQVLSKPVDRSQAEFTEEDTVKLYKVFHALGNLFQHAPYSAEGAAHYQIAVVREAVGDHTARLVEQRLIGDKKPGPGLPIWTAYYDTVDAPKIYTCRKFMAFQGYVQATNEVVASLDIEGIRMAMQQRGLWRIPRTIDDDPNIIETYV